MPANIWIFIIITAVVIALTRIILSAMEYKDQAKGIVAPHEEYKMSYLLKLIMLDAISPVTNKIKERKRKKVNASTGQKN